MPLTITNLYEMIGAPLVAMVQGESLAAQAAAEFIETVGFVPPAGSPTDNYGKLRMVTFSYLKQDINGQAEVVEMQLPVLSLVPIPLLQIAEGEIEFGVKITDVVKVSSHSRLRSGTLSAYPLNLPLSHIQGMVATPLKFESQTQTDVQMNVKVKVRQADIPEGLKQLFRVFDVGVQQGSPQNTQTDPDTGNETAPDDHSNPT